MKLTKYMREAFVRGVMNDVPKVDYQAQADAMVRKAVRDAMPEGLRKLVDQGGEALDWLKVSQISVPGHSLSSVRTYCPESGGHDFLKFKNPNVWSQLTEINRLAGQQGEQRQALQNKLTGAANSVTTRKALAELLPEFEKYLPADTPAATRMLPVVVGVVDDFKKAGWPGKVSK